MKRDGLITLLAHWTSRCERGGFWVEEDTQAYEQIVALLKKPEYGEEWIEEKAKEMMKLHWKTWILEDGGSTTEEDLMNHKDFIRKLMEDVSITVDPHGKSGK